MKDPAFLFYYSDFVVGTDDMTNEEAGAYIRCLCFQAAKGVISERHMIKICNSHEVHNAIKSKFIFDETQDGYYNFRLRKEIEKRQNYSKSRSDNRKGAKRESEDMNNICKTYDKHMEDINININIDDIKVENKDKRVQGEKEKEKKNSKTQPLWKTDFQIYLSELRVAYLELLNNREWMEEKKRYNPGIDIHLTLEKACKEYWATEAGWTHKKKSKTETIDWKTTLTNALSIKSNKVYEQQQKSTGNNRKELEGLRDLSERVLQSLASSNNSWGT